MPRYVRRIGKKLRPAGDRCWEPFNRQAYLRSRLLNVPPDQNGVPYATDVEHLKSFAALRIQTFTEKSVIAAASREVASRHPDHPDAVMVGSSIESCWSPEANDSAPSLTADLGRTDSFNTSMRAERREHGPFVANITLGVEVDGNWQKEVTATITGCKQLSFPAVRCIASRLQSISAWVYPCLQAWGCTVVSEFWCQESSAPAGRSRRIVMAFAG